MGIEFNGKVPEIKLGNSDEKKLVIPREADPAEIGKLLGQPKKILPAPAQGAIRINWEEVERIQEQLGLKKKEPAKPTKENLEAKAKLNEMVSSTGVKYSDAEQTINDIRAKYNDDKYFTTVRVQQDDNSPVLSYNLPVEVKKFVPSRLPEPARTEYLEAIAAKEEIENNNEALVKKAGPAVSKSPDDYTGVLAVEVDATDSVKLPYQIKPLEGTDSVKLPFQNKPVELTEKQKAAREQLNDKVSSTGVRYEDAKNILSEIEAKYKDDPNCQSMFNSHQPTNIALYIAPRSAFDPYKLPEPAKTEYFDALTCVQEIQEKNSALVKQAGLGFISSPSRDYYDEYQGYQYL